MAISMTLIFECDNCHHQVADQVTVQYMADGAAVQAMADDLVERRGWEITKGISGEIISVHCPACPNPYLASE